MGKVIAVIGNQGRPSENDYASHMLYLSIDGSADLRRGVKKDSAIGP